MPFFYSVFGFDLRSNEPIPGLVTLPANPKVDVQVWLNLQPPWLEVKSEVQKMWRVSTYLDGKGQPIWMVRQLADGDYFQLAYCDRTEFIINRDGTEIWATWPDSLTLEDTATYLLGPVLGFVLRLRGVNCLHSSAVAVAGRAIAFVGESGAGKSTTAAALAQRGYSVLSDDIVALSAENDKFLVQPAYGRLRLWPPSVMALYDRSDALPLLTPNWDKRYLGSDRGLQFCDSPLPLGAIYILGDRSSAPGAPYVEGVAACEGAIALIANTYANLLLDKTMRAKEFDFLCRVATSVPVRRVTPHSDWAYLSKLCDALLEDFQSLESNCLF